MKVLILCSGNAPNFKFEINQAFVFDQVSTIFNNYPEIEFDYFFVKGLGIKGYLSNLNRLKRKLKEHKVDIIHAHFALSGLLANLQIMVPVVCTFHGSDINNLRNRIIAAIVELLSQRTIYVSKNLYNKAFFKSGENKIPCGVDLEIFKPVCKELARQKMNLDTSKHYILFSSSFNNKVKNFELLKESCNLLKCRDLVIIELRGYSRDEVALLMNAADICAMTSFSEGSPQFIKEAMACNCPVVSTNVGDVKDVIGNTEGCYISTYEVNDVIAKISLALDFAKKVVKTNGRERIRELGLDSESVAKQVVEVYRKVLSKNN